MSDSISCLSMIMKEILVYLTFKECSSSTQIMIGKCEYNIYVYIFKKGIKSEANCQNNYWRYIQNGTFLYCVIIGVWIRLNSCQGYHMYCLCLVKGFPINNLWISLLKVDGIRSAVWERVSIAFESLLLKIS